MFNNLITTPLSLFVSLSTLTGVTVHDTKIDKLTTTIMSMPVAAANVEAASKAMMTDPHNQVERVSVKDMKTSQPRIMPRDEYKKHQMQKHAPKGAQSFDGYRIPLA